MLRKSERKPPGVKVAQYETHATDRCNFHRDDKNGECGAPAATALILTNPSGAGVLLRLCRRHLCRLSIVLIEELE
jgi:hypothetical protein